MNSVSSSSLDHEQRKMITGDSGRERGAGGAAAGRLPAAAVQPSEAGRPGRPRCRSGRPRHYNGRLSSHL